ncbi:MAG: hypothetical protein ACRBN8_08045 [Nannocystales bacterium]
MPSWSVMSRWALSVVVALCAAGCTRLNGAFDEEPAETDRPSKSMDASGTTSSITGDPTRDSATTLDATTDSAPATEDSTDTTWPGESSTGTEICFKVHGADGDCDLYSAGTCLDGHCRPYGADEEFTGVACVEQPAEIQPLQRGDPCVHRCGGVLGADACPERSLCDPFSDLPTCVSFCDPDEVFPCEPGSYCFLYTAGVETFGLCHPNCNPLSDPPDCPQGQTCVTGDLEDGFICVPSLPGAGQQGDPCAFLNECAVGLTCAGDGAADCEDSGPCCTPFCSVAAGDCPEGEFCEEVALGVGICAFE